ncbi:MAG: hypothetical protein R3Y35_11830 [Clostridia bacterium]
MTKINLQEFYLGDKYNVMGEATKDFLLNGSPDIEEQTGIELLIVKHTLIAAEKMKLENDYILEKSEM